MPYLTSTVLQRVGHLVKTLDVEKIQSETRKYISDYDLFIEKCYQSWSEEERQKHIKATLVNEQYVFFW